MPDISADFRTIKVSIRPGIYFQDDPAFKGKRRELVAADYVYQLKRVADPRWKSPLWTAIESSKIVGLAEARKRAQASGKFDYDAEIEGIRVLDRYTFQIKLAEPGPRFYENLTDTRVFGAVAREVVETYPDEIMGNRSVPARFASRSGCARRRSSSSAIPTFRDEFYDAAPATDDVEGQASLARLKGRRLPLVDRVELSIIEENQPRWLSFLNGQQDTINIPAEFIDIAAPTESCRRRSRNRAFSCDECSIRMSSSPTSTWTTQWSADTRRIKSHCVAQSASATTPTRKSAWSGAVR